MTSNGYPHRDAMVSIFEAYNISQPWKDLVIDVKQRDNDTCRNCGNLAGKGGTIHHLSYVNWGKGDKDESDDCVLLCRKCHIETHKRGDVIVPFWAQRKVNNVRREFINQIYMDEL